MTAFLNPLFTLFFISFLTISCFGQSKEISIRYIGNCGLHITDGTTHIYTDFPYKSGAHRYAEYDNTELDKLEENSFYIFTHKHSDHYSKKLLKKTLAEKKGEAFGPWNIDEFATLEKLIPDFKIEIFKTKHRFTFNHYSLLITWHGKRFFLSGDTEHAETIGGITNMDWAFIPAWLVLDVNEKKIKLDTKMVGIYHIGPKDDVNISGEKVVMFKQSGQIVTLPY